jgi:hypothetical protein
MQLYSQRDPAWANHALGWGPALGTIGAYGCFDTVLAMIAADSGHPLNPAQLDELLTAKRIFVRDQTGTFDLLPDTALPAAFPGDYSEGTFWGFRADLIAAAVPSLHTYAIGWISTATVPTHFVLFYSPDGRLIADPWTGKVGTLAGYGGPAAIKKTILVTRVPPAPRPAPTPVPVPLPPEPIPVPSPVPLAFYSFHVTPPDDLHPADGVMPEADARQLAADYIADKGADVSIEVLDQAGAIVVSVTGHGE